jgi:hypothetical protein
MKGFIKGLAQWIFIALSMYALIGSAILPGIGLKVLSILIMLLVPIIIFIYRHNPSASEAEQEADFNLIASCTIVVFALWLPLIMIGITTSLFPK